MAALLETASLAKSFGNHTVLQDISLEIVAGEIHGLVGANGSGKTTLMKILAGHPVISQSGGYQGHIHLDGQSVHIRTPMDALRLGIGMVHQEFALLEEMTVSENIKLGREQVYGSVQRGAALLPLDHKHNRDQVRQLLQKLKLSVHEHALVKYLPINQKQFVEIARETDKNDLRLLLLDEPTAALNEQDAKRLMDILRQLADKGLAILFISHRLEEVAYVCDRVTVMRDGRQVAQYMKADIDTQQLSFDMFNCHVLQQRLPVSQNLGETVLQFCDYRVQMPGDVLHNFNLQVRRGEVIGVSGLTGHGKLAVAAGLFGRFAYSGTVLKDGQAIPQKQGDANESLLRQGLAFVPEDRQSMGLLPLCSVEDNLTFSLINLQNRFLGKGFGGLRLLKRNNISTYAKQCVEQYQIKCNSLQQPVRQLSGGNQQKVCLAHTLALNPEILFISEPTRGIDLEAKDAILQLLYRLSLEKQMTIMITSSELEELRRICHRIVILYEGRIRAILDGEASDEAFSHAFSGAHREAAAYA